MGGTNLIDEIGKRYGRWLVISQAESDQRGARWLCRCDCGTERTVLGVSLRKRQTKSCGCLSRGSTSKRQLKDLTGQRFGRWTVVKQAEKSKRGQIRWLCRCDCGTERAILSGGLRSGNSQSCGCLRRELQSNRQLINEIGNKYGRWTVLEQAGNDKRGQACWLCQCDCGERRIVRGSTLRSGQSLSCGCLQRESTSKRQLIDLVGKRYGKLTVIRRVKDNDKWGYTRWLCKCDCGEEHIVKSCHLRNGDIKSCGCWRREFRLLPKSESSLNKKLGEMKAGAKKRGYEWHLTKEQVAHLISQPCHYCGAEPQSNTNSSCNYNGLDRVDNSKGYTIDNVVPCCWICNRRKAASAVEEFTSWIHRSHEHLAGI